LRPWVTLGSTSTPEGGAITLCQRGEELVIRAEGKDLMSSRMHGSEEAMAELVRTDRPGARVLVGGLGMGFTLRAALDTLPTGGRVAVAELFDAVVEWNRGPLGHLAGHPLDDPRTDVIMGDVTHTLQANPGAWDIILLDVDNGPSGFSQASNDGLYTLSGLNRTRMALRKGGTLAVWSAYEDRDFERRMSKAGFRTGVHRVRARGAAGGPRHLIYVGRTG
jgi:spermidine synthase